MKIYTIQYKNKYENITINTQITLSEKKANEVLAKYNANSDRDYYGELSVNDIQGLFYIVKVYDENYDQLVYSAIVHSESEPTKKALFDKKHDYQKDNFVLIVKPTNIKFL